MRGKRVRQCLYVAWQLLIVKGGRRRTRQAKRKIERTRLRFFLTTNRTNQTNETSRLWRRGIPFVGLV
jgi:hypothetical protein